jgi:lysophospholipase L1-like esterase
MNCAVVARRRAASMRRLALVVTSALGATACFRGAITPPTSAITAPAGRFESEIRAFEDSDRVNPPRSGGVVFVGSSSIRLWPDLRADFPGINVIQRGFGGSRLDEVVRYTPRIVLPYTPTLIVLYAGENDLVEDRTPEQVFDAYKTFVRLVRDPFPQARIAFVSIKPSPSRWELVDKMRITNEMIRGFAATHPGLSFVDVFPMMIGPNGRPRSELFVSDSLHMNHNGYAIWRGMLLPIVSSAPTH